MRKKKSITLYNGGFLFIIIFAIVLLMGVVKKNLINWTRFFTQTQSTQSYTSPDYPTQQEEYTWKQQKQLRYNWSTGKNEYAYPEEILRYNWSTRYWEYALPDEQLKYNWSTGYWEY